MDLPQHDDLFKKLGVSINGRGAVVDNVGFFVVSAVPFSPLHTPDEISEKEISRRIYAGYASVKQFPLKVFVLHAPPYGTRIDIIHSGIHVGSTAVREFIEVEQPDIFVRGHVHEGQGEDRIEKSRIVNCGSASNGYYVIVKLAPDIKMILRQRHGKW